MTHASIEFWTNVEEWAAIIVTLIAILIGLYRFSSITLASRYLLISVIIGFTLNKMMDVIQAKHPNYPMFLYANYMAAFIFGSLFFNYSIPQYRKIKIGIYMSAAGLLFWVFYSIFFQPMAYDQNNHSYIYYDSFFSLLCIALSLGGMYFMFQESSWREIKRNEVFWYFLIYVFGDGIGFIAQLAMAFNPSEYMFFIGSVFLNWLPNTLSVLFLGILFLRYPKNIVPDER